VTDWDSIIASPHYAGKRIFPVTVEGKRYWVKRAHRSGRRFVALRDEVLAIAAVRRRGVLVPSVAHQTDAYIVVTDLGETLQRHLESANMEERMRCAQMAGDVLHDLHRQCGWHGNAALRNLMFAGDRIGMIDFENSAHRWMPLTGRQVFDAWQVIHSLAQFDEREALIGAFLERYRPARRVLAWLRRMAWALSPLLLLAPFARFLKRDFRQGVYGLRAILSRR